MNPSDDAPQRSGLLADVIAGLSMAGLLLPEAVAYSTVAGLPPAAGLIGLLAGLVCYGLLGTSRFAIVAATSSSAAVLGAATLSIAGSNGVLRAALAAGLVMLTGAAFVLAALAQLGTMSSFIAKPVLRGFAFGLAVSIVIHQLPSWTGVRPASHFTLPFAWELLRQAPRWSPVGLSFGLLALAALRGLARFRKLPAALLVIAVGIGAGQYLPLPSPGVALVGPIGLAFAQPVLPELSQTHWARLGELAIALLLLLFAESYGSIRTMAIRHGDAVAPNRDLFALGVANLVSGLFQGTPVGAGYSATAANEAAGASSRAAGWVAASTVLVLVLTVLPWIELTPQPVLAAVVIHALSHSLSLAAFRPYFQWRRDRLVVIAAASAVLLLGVLDGLLIGIAVSLAMMLRDLSEPRISELGRIGDSHDFLSRSAQAGAAVVPGLLILRPEAPLFFANVDGLLSEAHRRIEAANPRGVVLSLEESSDLDGSSVEALQEFAASLEGHGIRLVLARVKERVLDVLRVTSGRPLHDGMLEVGSVDDAVRRLLLPAPPCQGPAPSAQGSAG